MKYTLYKQGTNINIKYDDLYVYATIIFTTLAAFD